VAEQAHGKRPTRVRFPVSAPKVGKHCRRCACFVSRKSEFDSRSDLHTGQALRASNRPITDRDGVRFSRPVPTGASFNGRISRLHREDESSILSVSTRRSEGWAMWSSCGAENPAMHVRFVPLPPSVAVAQWQSGGLWPRPREFDSLRSPHLVPPRGEGRHMRSQAVWLATRRKHRGSSFSGEDVSL
jgi:hypothetical protein